MNHYRQKIKRIKNLYGKFNNSELENVLNVLDADSNIDYIKKLENLFCKTFGVKYAIACNSGTSGLHSALASLSLKKDDEVIVPGLTVVMDAYAALHVGATPIFADVDIDKLYKTMRLKTILDLRNILNPKKVVERGFNYFPLGFYA